MSRVLKSALALAVTVACLAWLLQGRDLDQLQAALAATAPLPVVAAFLLALGLPFWRGARLAHLVPTTIAPEPGALTRIAAEVLLWTFLLPFKLGELSFPWLLNRRLGLPLGEAVAVFLLVRVADLLAVVGLGLVALAIVEWAPVGEVEAPLAAAGVLALVSPLVLVVAAQRLRGVWGGLVGQLFEGAAHARSARARFWFLTTTVGLWSTHGLIAWLVLRSHDIDLGLAWALLASSAAALAFALPVTGVLGLGPQQVAFATVIEVGGTPAEVAVAAALTTYVVVLAAAVSCGLVARFGLVSPSGRAKTGQKPGSLQNLSNLNEKQNSSLSTKG